MSGYIRQIQSSDGEPISPPSTVVISGSSLVVFANDAAYEAAIAPGTIGSRYFNSTELIVRQHNGNNWGYDDIALNQAEDSVSTGSNLDLVPDYYNLIRFTEGSLASIRGIDSSTEKLLYLVNDQGGGQTITLLNEDGTATGAQIVTGTGDNLIVEDGQTITLAFDGTVFRVASGSGAGGGGLEIVNINNASSPVTVEIGKWYLADTTGGPITCNMPDISAIPSSKESSAANRFSDCASNWHVSAVTLVPFSGQSIDNQTADETMVLDVQDQYVWTSRDSVTNWCFDTSIQPTLEGSGGTGEGRVNLFGNSNFEDGTTDWSSTKPAQLSLETSAPLQGAQSLKVTSDGAGQVVSTTLTLSDLAYETIQHGIEGTIDIPLTAAVGEWQVRFKRNGTTIAHTEVDLAPGRNYLSTINGFAPNQDTISFEIEDLTATASDEAICDIFVLTPQGQGNVVEYPSYDETEVTVTGNVSWSTSNLYLRPYYDGSGKVLLEISIVGTTSSSAGVTLTIPGITWSFQQSIACGNGSTAGAAITTGSNQIVINNNGTSTTQIGGGSPLVLDSWPTWATKGGGVKLLTQGETFQNAKARFWRNGTQTISNNTVTPIIFNETSWDKSGGAFTLDDTTGIITFHVAGEYKVNCTQRYSTAFTGNLQNRINPSNGNPTTITNPGDSSVAPSIPADDAFEFAVGDTLTLDTYQDSGSNKNIVGNDQTTFVTIERIPDSTGNQAVGANTSEAANENPQNLLPTIQKGTWTPAYVSDLNMTGTATFEGATYYRTGDKVFVEMSGITGLTTTSTGTSTTLTFTSAGLPGLTNDTEFGGTAVWYWTTGNRYKVAGIYSNSGSDTNIFMGIDSDNSGGSVGVTTIRGIRFSYTIA